MSLSRSIVAETDTSFASAVLLFSFALSFLATTSFLITAVRDIAETLDIDVFDISKQVARAQAAKAAAGTPSATPAVAAPASASSASAAPSADSSEGEGTAAPVVGRKRRGSTAR
jgi:hypothetical protein